MTTASARSSPWRRRIVVAARWLHIYLSMGSLALILFFAVTGLTLNHPDWFSKSTVTTLHHGLADHALLRNQSTDGADKLALVELLRAHDHVHGAVTDFRVDDSQITISFASPGYTADAFFDRDSGKYDLTEVNNGAIAVLNDLHRGHTAGKVWARLIDASAILLGIVALTGLTLIWFIYKKRTAGLLLAAIATITCIVIFKFLVP